MAVSTNFSDNLECWMGNLPEELRKLPLIYLAIPGSHDAMSFNLSNQVAPDAEPIVSSLFKCIPCVVKNWAKTQKYTITQQLENGIRYFDLRISTKPNDDLLYFVHGLFCEEISQSLKELQIYLESQPNEFVILDCQHFYNFTAKNHKQLIYTFQNLFGSKIFGRLENGNDLKKLTLESAAITGKQLLIVYRCDAQVVDEFWFSQSYPTLWPNKVNVKDLKQYLETSLEKRSSNTGFVSQCVLTPDVKFIVPRFYSSLRKTCAKKVDAKLISWIQDQKPGAFCEGQLGKANVFLADFVDIKNNHFSKTVIDLNQKLLASSDD